MNSAVIFCFFISLRARFGFASADPSVSGIRVKVTMGLGLGGAGIALDRFWVPIVEAAMERECRP